MEALVHIGLTNAALAVFLALLAAGAGRICRRPALIHALWLLVLLKLLTPPILSIDIPWPGPDTIVRAEHEPVLPDTQPCRDADADPLPEVVLDMNRIEATDAIASMPANEGLAEPAAGGAVLGWTRIALSQISWVMMAGICWLAGTLAWLALTALRVWRFRRLLRSAEPAPASLQDQAQRLADRLGLRRCPRLWLVPVNVSPMLWVWAGAPRVLLPSGLWSRLSQEQRTTLLAHELAHLRRGDHWVRRLELLAVALYWWHPTVWWAVRRLQETGEECCDAWVVGTMPASAEAYAEALVETLAFLSLARPPLPAGASGARPSNGLKRRLLMILNGSTPKSLSRAGWCAVLVLGGVGLPLWPTPAPGQASLREDRREEPVREVGRAPGPSQRAAEPTRRELQEENARLRGELEALQQRMRQIEKTLAGFKQGTLGVGRVLRSDEESRPPMPPPAPRAPMGPAPVADPRMPDLPATAALGQPGGPSGFGRPRAGPVPTAGGVPVGGLTVRQSGDYDRRMRALEEKLDRVLEELKSLREQRSGRSERGRTTESEP
jgi:beta-lactamase regulating signal transducer with metallopeptidase domain